MDLMQIAEQARAASKRLLGISTVEKNRALEAIAENLKKQADYILKQNAVDVKNAAIKGTPEAMLDRLRLTKERIDAMADGVLYVSGLPDPVGETVKMWKRPNGLEIGQKRVPIGTIGIIYEARPNVTADAAALCLKTSNAVILRGGSEAINSNLAIVKVMNQALDSVGYVEGAVQILSDTSRETATKMMKLNGYIDVLIPRGGAGLIRTVVQNSTIPVIETGTGNCHIYMSEDGDVDMGVAITVNAKTSRPSVCNAAETLLVDEAIAETFLPRVLSALEDKNVEIRGCERTCAVWKGCKRATESDYATEFLDYIMAVKVVKNIDDAIAHINKYGTKHSECIITSDYKKSRHFTDMVDAAAVYVNASTRFTDGFEFGFGAEIGISTQKLHARGPMGLTELTTVKYVIFGDGQIRE